MTSPSWMDRAREIGGPRIERAREAMREKMLGPAPLPPSVESLVRDPNYEFGDLSGRPDLMEMLYERYGEQAFRLAADLGMSEGGEVVGPPVENPGGFESFPQFDDTGFVDDDELFLQGIL